MYYSFSFGNEKNYKPTIIKKGYEYIPLEYLSDTSIYGIIKEPRLVFDERADMLVYDNSFVNEFMFFWGSYCTDGRYYMTVSPEQIYLYDSHENPNPNTLCWVINIDSIVLKTLQKDYKKINGLDCDNNSCYDEKYNEGVIFEQNENYDCGELLNKQTKKMIDKINKLIKDKKHKIDFNKRISPKFMFFNDSYGKADHKTVLNYRKIIFTK